MQETYFCDWCGEECPDTDSSDLPCGLVRKRPLDRLCWLPCSARIPSECGKKFCCWEHRELHEETHPEDIYDEMGYRILEEASVA